MSIQMYGGPNFRPAITPNSCSALLIRYPVGTLAQRKTLLKSWEGMRCVCNIDERHGIADCSKSEFLETREAVRRLGLALPRQERWYQFYSAWWNFFKWPKVDHSESSVRPQPTKEEREELCNTLRRESVEKRYRWVPDPGVDLLLSIARPNEVGEFDNYDPIISETLLGIYNDDPLRLSSANGSYFFRAKFMRTSDEGQRAKKLSELLTLAAENRGDCRILPMLIELPPVATESLAHRDHLFNNAENLLRLSERYPILWETDFWRRFDKFPDFLIASALQMHNELGMLRLDEQVMHSILGISGGSGPLKDHFEADYAIRLIGKYGWRAHSALQVIMSPEQWGAVVKDEGTRFLRLLANKEIDLIREIPVPMLFSIMLNLRSDHPNDAVWVRKFLLDERVQSFSASQNIWNSQDQILVEFLYPLKKAVKKFEEAGNGTHL